jgi:hypothetical protein
VGEKAKKMRVKYSWASDDTKTETIEFNSSDEMLDFTFNIHDRIILHKLSKDPKDITYVVDENDRPFDFFIMIYDSDVEDQG